MRTAQDGSADTALGPLDVRPSRELREPSFEGAQSSRVRRRLRSERGQAAVEFALVVPLLCLIIVAILHFGKVMNYWLDLNHVASEGARKAAVNTFASDGEYDTYSGAGWRRPSFAPAAPARSRRRARSMSACWRGRRRRPGEGAGRGAYSMPLHRQDDHASRQRHDAAGAARRLRGRRNMRVSVGAQHRGSRGARGGRHPRVRRDAGPDLPALPRRSRSTSATGGCTSGTCRCRSTQPPSPAARSSAIASPTRRARTWRSRTRRRASAAPPGRATTSQVGGTTEGNGRAQLPEHDVPVGRRRSERRHRDQRSVRHGAPDARRQGERGGHSAAASSASSSCRSGRLRDRDQHPRARGAEAGRDPGGAASRRRSRISASITSSRRSSTRSTAPCSARCS